MNITSESAGIRRPRGRPRDEGARRRILLGALRLLAEHGLKGLTMEAIAAEANVSKQTVYKWWPSRGAVALDALTEYTRAAIAPLTEDGINGALVGFLSQTFAALTPETRKILAGLMAETQQDEKFAEQFRRRVIDVRRDAFKDLLAKAEASGEITLTETVDADFLADIVYGVMWYRLLVQHAPVDETLVEQLTDAVLTLAPRR